MKRTRKGKDEEWRNEIAKIITNSIELMVGFSCLRIILFCFDFSDNNT